MSVDQPVPHGALWEAVKRAPWEKIAVWSIVALAAYALRHFFLLLLLTFLLSNAVRGLVLAIAHRVSPGRERVGLERALTIAIFVLLALGLAEVGSIIGPGIVVQSRGMVARIERLEPQQEFDNLLKRTVGAYLFWKTYGSPNDARYKDALARYAAGDDQGAGLYQEFPSLMASLEAGFEARFDEEQIRKLQEKLHDDPASERDFERWFLTVKAPEVFERQRDVYLAKWLAQFVTPEGLHELDAMKQDPSFVNKRDEQIRQRIYLDVQKDPATLSDLQSEWEQQRANQRWQILRQSASYQSAFHQYFDERRAENPDAIRFNFDEYNRLKEAYPKGKKAFVAALGDKAKPSLITDPKHAQADFELTMEWRLARQWWASDPTAISLRERLKASVETSLAAAGDWIRNAVQELITIPVQVAMAVLLSVLITFDLANLRRGIDHARQRNPLVDHLFREIGPGAQGFARTIALSFRAQIIIAGFNTALTLLAMWLVGVDSRWLLAQIVFLCSFIPVLGVVFSGMPITLVALLQPGGSFVMAIEVIIAILLIHLLETTVLSPRILGNLMHLHPIVVLAALSVSEHFFGIWGLLLGVPVTAYFVRTVVMGEEPLGAHGLPAEPAD